MHLAGFDINTERCVGICTADGPEAQEGLHGGIYWLQTAEPLGAEYKLTVDETGVTAEHRPSMPVTQTGLHITAPPGTAFVISGPAHAEGTTETGELELEFSEPGAYTITLRLWPYLDAELTHEN